MTDAQRATQIQLFPPPNPPEAAAIPLRLARLRRALNLSGGKWAAVGPLVSTLLDSEILRRIVIAVHESARAEIEKNLKRQRVEFWWMSPRTHETLPSPTPHLILTTPSAIPFNSHLLTRFTTLILYDSAAWDIHAGNRATMSLARNGANSKLDVVWVAMKGSVEEEFFKCAERERGGEEGVVAVQGWEEVKAWIRGGMGVC
ncbi:hypothetical protein BDK51DRAFT_37620 [Blyttiomyces helicus]|uniref:Uncharacterized protein n=1 Tax=Blyttiomyces helicus TaxID=388810 RepID=A0A4P9W6W7_9FUNG|nr:hypothetical protein BDK51DRAFT_37620 [Blyttiomyces helicus]|eukprot:RKO88084.1 hypothetical protein BDK51DRAFT_37620 [Blyttiomyces helicus]